jgi:hypothetical protein
MRIDIKPSLLTMKAPFEGEGEKKERESRNHYRTIASRQAVVFLKDVSFNGEQKSLDDMMYKHEVT